MKGPGASGGKVYNVEQAVGKNSPNASGDVKLVQYLLKHIYGMAAAGLAVDGYIGPVTSSWIQKFQNDQKLQGVNVLPDGRVDRAFGGVSTVSKTIYTILLMNEELRKKNPAAFANLPSQVAMNPNPKATPYNPKQKKVVDYKVVLLPRGKKRVTYTYADGTQETAIVSGDVVIDGKKVQGQKVVINVIHYWVLNDLHQLIQYSDGTQELVITPMGPVS
jgi:peptidoglycan hydrolase-like protein with peptidoglycan-binding domain